MGLDKQITGNFSTEGMKLWLYSQHVQNSYTFIHVHEIYFTLCRTCCRIVSLIMSQQLDHLWFPNLDTVLSASDSSPPFLPIFSWKVWVPRVIPPPSPAPESDIKQPCPQFRNSSWIPSIWLRTCPRLPASLILLSEYHRGFKTSPVLT